MLKVEHATEAPALWGGLECTINRVANKYLDQLDLGGFYERPEDLDAVISTGISVLRFPVLWERHQPNLKCIPDFSWATIHLYKLRDAGVTPVIGLVHHGSGPDFTDLLDEGFPEKLAAYAGQVAREFPWVRDYTPVNEPLTTARFSGLYGFWYPHRTNDVTFIKMLLNQLKAVVLSMREIRKINPAARLIQTEDLGKTYSTPILSYQADFENHRRWLTFDILTGKLDEKHLLWNYCMRLGIDRSSLQFFIDNPCTPDIIGVNHYLTSERYLDNIVHAYAPHLRGGNGIHEYADVEAVRVDLRQPHGVDILLREISARYGLPVAITEAHLHCSREEQLRWFEHLYSTASKLKDEGLNIVAVTAWSMLGSFGWDKLLTGTPATYESGVFDTSAGYARPTALANLLRSVTEPNFHAGILSQQPGWWVRPSRHRGAADPIIDVILPVRPLVILGGTGKLGGELAEHCEIRHIHFIAPGKETVDICNSRSIEEMITDLKPWAIINAAGYVDVEAAEREPEECYRLNTLGPQKLAILCEQYNIKLVNFSTDLVFDGSKEEPYAEDSVVNPLSVYGKSKVHAETFLRNVNSASLSIRTSAFFSPRGKGDFVSHILYYVSRGLEVDAPIDQVVSPTYVPHLAEATLNLLIDDACGIWHLVNRGATSWFELACMAADQSGLDTRLIRPVSTTNQLPVKPRYSVLTSNKYGLMPTLKEAMVAYFSHELMYV